MLVIYYCLNSYSKLYGKVGNYLNPCETFSGVSYRTKLLTIFQSHFEDNPRDLQLLRHDKNLHTVKTHQNMTHVPEYLGMYKFVHANLF